MRRACPASQQLTTSPVHSFLGLDAFHFHTNTTHNTNNKDREMSAADDDDMVVDQQGQGQEDGEEAPRSGMCTMIGGGGWGQDTFDVCERLSQPHTTRCKPYDDARSRKR